MSVKQEFNISVFFKWLVLVVIISIAAGSLSALFLSLLNWATQYHEHHRRLIYCLPLAGLSVGLLYQYWGQDTGRGNGLVFDTIHDPKEAIPFRMTPLVLLGTVATHLFGGSAGREGTALQMSAAAADQLYKPFKLDRQGRSILLIAALSGGFSSVFGTPLAGAIFGMEVLFVGMVPYRAILPALSCAFLSAWITGLWGVGHTNYQIGVIPELKFSLLLFSLLAGAAFALAAVLFVKLTHLMTAAFNKIFYAPLRPFAGGIIVLLLVLLPGMYQYTGLGIPQILESFQQISAPQDFALKILLTAITLGAGFKGGEVTPLFFIGATLGSALSLFLPLPTGLLAGMGFVAVFAGAAKTPIACTVMALELFGFPCAAYVAIACAVSYFLSGKHSIYNPKFAKQFL
ncbi:MAG TPA: chloride channel protein [Pedobacter sp.]|nr:chloride channel protein [Pedobacter sp.]